MSFEDDSRDPDEQPTPVFKKKAAPSGQSFDRHVSPDYSTGAMTPEPQNGHSPRGSFHYK